MRKIIDAIFVWPLLIPYYICKGIIYIIELLILDRIPFLKRNKENQYTMSYVDSLSGEQFEYYLLDIFKQRGYSGFVTSTTGDFGADLILKTANETTVVQAKRYSGNVGVEAIQQIVAAKG